MSVQDLFLGPSEESRAAYLETINDAADHVASAWGALTRPVDGMDYDRLLDCMQELDVCPERGVGLRAALNEVREQILPHIVTISDPRYVAHYHSPPIFPSLAAEVFLTAMNQSLDSFDQSPSATALETHVITWLCDLVEFGSTGGGVFTSGATQSNLMGLFLARDGFALRELGCDVGKYGLPKESRQWSIIASDLAHFSVAKGAHFLGLGADSVVTIPTSSEGTISAQQVDVTIADERRRARRPIALVLTAGTTEVGSIDPIEECTRVAQSHGLWVHLDAAVGGALLLSERYRGLLRGINLVDSVAIDFHKWFFQAISCGAFAVRDASTLKLFQMDVPYLDPVDARDDAAPNLVGKTIQTTRRFDALKVFLSLRALGRETFASLIEHTMRLTATAAELIEASDVLVLLSKPVTNTLVFRWDPPGRRYPLRIDQVNQRLPALLWKQGSGVLGRTRRNGSHALKMTFINPLATVENVQLLLQAIETNAESCWEELAKIEGRCHEDA